MYHSLEETKLKDLQKEKVLKAMSLEIIRFTEKQVRYEINHVLSCITAKISELEQQKRHKSPTLASGNKD